MWTRGRWTELTSPSPPTPTSPPALQWWGCERREGCAGCHGALALDRALVVSSSRQMAREGRTGQRPQHVHLVPTNKVCTASQGQGRLARLSPTTAVDITCRPVFNTTLPCHVSMLHVMFYTECYTICIYLPIYATDQQNQRVHQHSLSIGQKRGSLPIHFLLVCLREREREREGVGVKNF